MIETVRGAGYRLTQQVAAPACRRLTTWRDATMIWLLPRVADGDRSR